jgi:hypothetical protein
MLRLLESGRLDAVLQVAWQLTVAAVCLYAPHPRAVGVAAHAARIAVRNKQQSNTMRRGSRRCHVVRAGKTAADEVVRGRWR